MISCWESPLMVSMARILKNDYVMYQGIGTLMKTKVCMCRFSNIISTLLMNFKFLTMSPIEKSNQDRKKSARLLVIIFCELPEH
jgi:hypothetical protein